MAVAETYYRVAGDFSLYEAPAQVTLGSRTYSAAFDPFDLTDIGQKFITLSVEIDALGT